jgi:hypothetical protein
MSPQEDASSIGNILLAMGIISEAQLWDVLVEQHKLREDQLLGKLLVASGVISAAQLTDAMELQKVMRSSKKRQAALAQADLAIARHRRHSLVAARERIIATSHKIAQETRCAAGDDHPVVLPLLAEGTED